MAKHINHFDCQNKMANTFKTISNRNSDDNEDLSLQAQLKNEAERKQENINKPSQQPKEVKRRYAGWVVVKRYDLLKRNDKLK